MSTLGTADHTTPFTLYVDTEVNPLAEAGFLEEIAKGFEDFVRAYYRPHSPHSPCTAFQELVENGQHPIAFVNHCCDSRSNAALALGSQPGQLFTNATIGALIPAESGLVRAARRVSPRLAALVARYNVLAKAPHTWAAIEYAVHGLKVPHVVVLGHTGCGGLRALVDKNATGHTAYWVDTAKPVLAAARKLYVPSDTKGLYRAVEQANVVCGVRNVSAYLDDVFARVTDRPPPEVHGLLFDMHNAALLRLTDARTGTFERITRPVHTHFHPKTCDLSPAI